MEKRLRVLLLLVLGTILMSSFVFAGALDKEIGNKILFNKNPFGETVEPVPIYFILVANLTIIIFELILLLSLYSIAEKFGDKNMRVLVILVGYLILVLPVFLYTPISFVFITVFYMFGILVPSIIKKKYISIHKSIGFGSGFDSEDVKGFGSHIGRKETVYYD